MPRRKNKKKGKGFKLEVGSKFESIDDTLEITKIDNGVFFTLTSKHGLPIFHSETCFGMIRSILKSDKFTQII